MYDNILVQIEKAEEAGELDWAPAFLDHKSCEQGVNFGSVERGECNVRNEMICGDFT